MYMLVDVQDDALRRALWRIERDNEILIGASERMFIVKVATEKYQVTNRELGEAVRDFLREKDTSIFIPNNDVEELGRCIRKAVDSV